MSDYFKTRREFLRTGIWGASASWTLPLFLQRTFGEIDVASRDLAVQAASGKDDEILVVLQMAGGNDGLNTLVPFGDEEYHKARPTLAKKEKDLIRLTDGLGLNDNLKALGGLYDEGELAIVQGVGYPNPNRSHFVSTTIWETADPAARSNTGWLGRYFDNQCEGSDPMIGVSLRKTQPESFGAQQNPGISLSAPELYRWIHGGDNLSEAQEAFAGLNAPAMGLEEGMAELAAGDSISEVGAPGTVVGEDNAAYLERVALNAQVSSEEVVKLARKHKSQANYPGTQLGQSLGLVGRMIAGGMPTRVYYVNHGGFDTHRQQEGRHDQLLGQMDDALKAFFADLKAQGNYQRVTVMTFSEFGRRVGENASAGTDHGQGSCLFVAGGGVKGGLYGQYPSLTDLSRGDLKFTTDFRKVYATLLDGWLKTDSQKILGKKFAGLGFLG
ncbi:DUF1501 domain-containing protein [Roseibacillus ishigakijimensis]|uniref:DUF1501 domain-containing protein n=1 Tax=Roseibacillus ishigakijimensis TaxID=454146 RepID=A0A934RVC3_9BACT|nr:DUF1501 domain-containing protein [Roseibacillus ishigakijimensis]MBK1834840.1 DUF1501 domain-containing protein [Roseibacillus ishigakijimensis]